MNSRTLDNQSHQRLLCVPIRARDEGSARAKIRRAGEFADLLELRRDLIASSRFANLVKASPVPVIATLRSLGEGGKGRFPHREASDILIESLEAGAAYVDVEMGMPRRSRDKIVTRAGAERVILSRHFPEDTPPMKVLLRLLDQMIQEDPGMIKIVSRAHSSGDVLRILALIQPAVERGKKIAAFCMGAPGRISRILSLSMGASLGFASLEKGDETADGQIPIQVMRRLFPRRGGA